jgi:hypothetical protein
MTPEVTATTSSPIVLASDQVTRADRLSVELVKPTDTPTGTNRSYTAGLLQSARPTSS